MANLDEIYDIDNRTAAFENHKNGVLVSLAGPGTGKTYSLLKRIQALMDRGNESNSICYLTFIKEISNAFTLDYIEDFGREAYEINRPRISTLHSLACRLIRNQGFRIGYSEELYFASITDSNDIGSKVFLEDLIPMVGSQTITTIPKLRSALQEVKSAWQNCIDPASLDEIISNIVPTFIDLLFVYRLIDWDQTIPIADTLFSKLAEKPNWISRIKHFLIDEYQDFNRAEQNFIASLSRSVESTVIVGDDDQSLYSGRGGSPDGLTKLYESKDLDQISLVRCRRCKSRIVEAANHFLSNIRSNPRSMAPLSTGGDIQCFRFKSTKAELDYLVRFLSKCIADLPAEPKSKDGIVCLFPSRKALDYYFSQISTLVPCTRRRPPDHKLRSRLQQILSLVCHPGQRFIERLILENYSSIKARHIHEMIKMMLQRDISPARAMEVLVAESVITGPLVTPALEFCGFCDALESRDSEAIAEKVSGYLGIPRDILQHSLDRFIGSLDDSDPEDAISSLCDELIPDSVQPPENLHSVLFLTMHGSKGLTKKTVIMPGLEEAWLPGDSQGSELDEKKRLFYVALTRATDQVLITVPGQRARGDPLNFEVDGRRRVSPFTHLSGIVSTYRS